MRLIPLIAIFAALTAILPGIAWSAEYHTPRRGSAERSAIMDAARPTIQGEIGGQIEFVVSVLRTDGRWAYLQSVPQRPGGAPIDWRRTKFARDWSAGIMSDIVMVLLGKSDGRWRVVDYVIGPTDVFWYEWIDRYRLPEALFNGG